MTFPATPAHPLNDQPYNNGFAFPCKAFFYALTGAREAASAVIILTTCITLAMSASPRLRMSIVPTIFSARSFQISGVTPYRAASSTTFCNASHDRGLHETPSFVGGVAAGTAGCGCA